MNTPQIKSISHPWQGHYMEPAFNGFVGFAVKKLFAQFLAETGENYISPKTPIDRMVDASTEADLAFAQRFVDWCVFQFGTPEQVFGDVE